MAKKDKKQKKFSFYWLCGKIGDILFIPIIIISIFSSVSMLVQRKQNKPTSVAGYSFVNILSGSMTKAGFIKGDTVITKKTSVEGIELGEVIAFYNYRDVLDSSTKKNLVIKYNYSNGTKELDTSEENIVIGIELGSIKKTERQNEKTVADAQKAKASVYFHQVIGIYMDNYGNVFYQTKGTNNASADNYIRSDFVVGEYVETPRFIRDAISFCASPKGMIMLVCIPLSILVLLQCFSLIKQIEVMSIERQIVAGKRRFNDEDIQKDFNGNEMETYNKVYLYYLTDDIEKDQVINFMWGDLLGQEKLSKKDEKLIDILEEANNKLPNSKKDYWNVWINGTKGYTKKRIKKYYQEDAIYQVFASKVVKNDNQNKPEIKENANSNMNKQALVNQSIKNAEKQAQTKQSQDKEIKPQAKESKVISGEKSKPSAVKKVAVRKEEQKSTIKPENATIIKVKESNKQENAIKQKVQSTAAKTSVKAVETKNVTINNEKTPKENKKPAKAPISNKKTETKADIAKPAAKIKVEKTKVVQAENIIKTKSNALTKAGVQKPKPAVAKTDTKEVQLKQNIVKPKIPTNTVKPKQTASKKRPATIKNSSSKTQNTNIKLSPKLQVKKSVQPAVKEVKKVVIKKRPAARKRIKKNN